MASKTQTTKKKLVIYVIVILTPLTDIKMDDVTALNILVAPCWWASVWVRHSSPVMISCRTWANLVTHTEMFPDHLGVCSDVTVSVPCVFFRVNLND